MTGNKYAAGIRDLGLYKDTLIGKMLKRWL